MQPAFAAPLSLVGMPSPNGILWLLLGLPTGHAVELHSGTTAEVHVAVQNWGVAARAFTDAMDPDREFGAGYRAEKLMALERSCIALTTALFEDDGPRLRELVRAGQVRRIDVTALGQGQHLPIDFCLVGEGSDRSYLGQDTMAVHRRTGTTIPELTRLFAPRPVRVPQVGYAEDDGLASACTDPAAPATPGREGVEEVNVFGPLVRSLADVVILGELRGRRSVDVPTFRDWLSGGHTVLHFNAHSMATASGDPSIRLRRMTTIGRADFRASSDWDRLRFAGCLVFLNVCNSGLGGPTYEDSIASEFVRQEADAVVCTIGPIIDPLATRFATMLYAELARAGVPLEHAFLAARANLIDEVGHPLPLLYTYVGRDDLTIMPGPTETPTPRRDAEVR